MSNAAHGHEDEELGLPHITPLKVYFGVWAALTFLTAVTVWVSYFDFGAYNLVVAMIVAVIKASLVGAFFMHLKYDNKLYTVTLLCALVFLAIFFFLTGADLSTRGKVDKYQGTFVKVHGQRDPNAPAVHEESAHH